MSATPSTTQLHLTFHACLDLELKELDVVDDLVQHRRLVRLQIRDIEMIYGSVAQSLARKSSARRTKRRMEVDDKLKKKALKLESLFPLFGSGAMHGQEF
jgi:hypothetical protein